jgi:hypothetical protein
VSTFADVVRRRHLARTWVRVAALLCVAKSLWNAADAMDGVILPYLATAFQGVIDHGFPITIWLGAGVLLVLFERPLVRWLVPAGSPDHTCLNCGYSLKNLKSPICPECGADVRPAR